MAETFDPYQQWLGIAPHERPVNHYRLLGLEAFEKDAAVIAAAADQRMQTLRRHQTGPRGAATQRLLNEISAAKVCLLDPAARAAYDEMLHGLVAANSDRSTPAPPQRPAIAVDTRRTRPTKRPYYLQPWFPAAAVAATLAIAAVVWLIGRDGWQHAATPAPPPADPPQAPRVRTPEAAPPPIWENDSDDDADWVAVQQEAAGDVNLSPALARISGGNLRLEFLKQDEALSGWKSDQDVARWRFIVGKLPPQAVFRVTVVYAGDSGSAYELKVGTERVTGFTRAASGEVRDEHFVAISETGTHELSMRAANAERLQVMRIVLSFPD